MANVLGPCLWSFLIGATSILVPLLVEFNDGLNDVVTNYWAYLLIANIIFVNSAGLLFYRQYDYQVQSTNRSTPLHGTGTATGTVSD